ncbi:MAG: FAD-dependent oxidoreductase [Phycisphaerales bacterium]|nr:FAD-dependent oxidoreductase [Phycisphaerales bacterium]
MTSVPSVPNVSRLGPVFREAHAAMSEVAAVLEAEACLQCGGPCAAAPCVRSCPTGIDIPGFIKDIAEGRPGDAAAKIFADNILGGTCARVCPVEVLCEGSCVLLKEGRRAIHIARLQRHATDRAIESGAALPAAGEASGKRVAVIGAGPSGLACAAELAKLGHEVTVYEGREFPGGLVTRSIAPYKQQYKPLPEEVERIRGMGVEVRFGVTVGKQVTAVELRREHDAVYLGVGMGDDMPARIPGEDLAGVWESLRFIEDLKLGVGVAAAGGPAGGKRVVVIGGGNTAIDVAREAVMLKTTETAGGNTAMDVARQSVMLGASEVVMLYRRSEAEMPAFPHEIAAAKREGVKIQPLAAPVEFIGEGGRLSGVKCIRMKLGAPDASGRPRPEPIAGSEFIIGADTVIKAIGQKPRKELLELFGVEMKGSVVRVDEDLRTSVPGVFAGGDCINGGSTVVEAVRDGRNAARAIDRALSGRARPEGWRPPPTRVESEEGLVKHFQEDFRLTTAPKLCKGCNVCVTGCPTSTLALDGSNHIVVKDTATCVFCGLCEARCPDFAIWIVRGESEKARTAVKGQAMGVTA